MPRATTIAIAIDIAAGTTATVVVVVVTVASSSSSFASYAVPVPVEVVAVVLAVAPPEPASIVASRTSAHEAYGCCDGILVAKVAVVVGIHHQHTQFTTARIRTVAVVPGDVTNTRLLPYAGMQVGNHCEIIKIETYCKRDLRYSFFFSSGREDGPFRKAETRLSHNLPLFPQKM